MAEITSTNTDIEGVRDLLKQSSAMQTFLGASTEDGAKERIYPFTVDSNEDTEIPVAFAIVTYGENYGERVNDFAHNTEIEPEMNVILGRLRRPPDELDHERNAMVGIDNDIQSIISDLNTLNGGSNFEFAGIRRLDPEVVEEYERDDWNGVFAGITLLPIVRGG